MKHSLNEILDNFKMEKPKKRVFGNYRIENNTLIYQAQVTEEKSFSNSEKSLEAFNNWSKDYNKFFDSRDSELNIEDIKAKILKGDYVRVKGKGLEVNEIARKIVQEGNTIFLGNSSILPLIGRTVSYGHESRNNRETEIQRLMSRSGFIMIPFSVFAQAQLDINSFKLVDRGEEENLIINRVESKWVDGKHQHVKIPENRHFTGASLFSVSGVHYLFDVDRREVKHKIFNPFLAKLPGKPKTIKEAYESLKPKAVLDAEKKGLKVLRQGEWFFIPTKAPKIRKLSTLEKMKVLAARSMWRVDELAKILKVDPKAIQKENEKLLPMIPRPQDLRAGNSRPNRVDLVYSEGKKVFCSGTVKHTGREHADLVLKGWFLAVPNTATENFTVTGDVD